MLSEQAIKCWHLGQIIVQEILIIVAFVLFLKIKPLTKSRLGAIIVLPILFILVLLQLTLLYEKHPEKNWFILNFQSVNILLCFFVLLTLEAAFIKILNNKNAIFLLIILTLYELIMLLPMAKLAWGKIKSPIGQIITLLLFASLIVSLPEILTMDSHSWLQVLNTTGITGSICFVISSIVVMKSWHYQNPSLRISPRAKYSVLAVIFIFIIADCLINAFNDADNLGQLLTRWDFHITIKHVTQYICQGIEAGVAEEWLMRFCVLSILLKIFKNSKNQILLAVLLNGLLFGSIHLTNALMQPFSATILQIINAFAAGIVFAAVYLYTGSFLVNMGYHAVYDILAFLATGSTVMTVPHIFDWEYLFIATLIYLTFAFFLLSGKRKSVIEYNLQQRGLENTHGVNKLTFR
ncbi:CPBP family intramembrane glutamic endopeptidase [uncultured Lactobacillus sp.]|uniref:CPBP family intramembrane glutamic endopeptidase n=1 Tax=uncultured Lactobacillus sp. TaxID=153152 RepID=UPI0025FEE203|nr:CPBP family intramembrane glutamic endopeptidase [uncultured Lactobacillus sp.]